MKYKTLSVIFVILMLGSFNVMAGNPGENAMRCISVSTNSSNYDNLKFKNTCRYKVFIVWCGSLKYSKKTCGSGSNYYTHSANIEGRGSKTTTIRRGSNGSFRYAACKGGIGFSSKGIKHPSSDRGTYVCTKTGGR